MKIVSFNANGIRSAARKGFFEWLQALQPDIVCIQETKAQGHVLDPIIFFPESYHCVYVDAVKKGYSGVAIYARQMPKAIVRSCGIYDDEGRYLQFDYEGFSVASIYFPSGTTGQLRQTVKYDFLDRMMLHLENLKMRQSHVILCGDFNIAHRAIDLKNWRGNQKNSGFLPEERLWMDQLLGPLGWVDAYRYLEPNTEAYTWWSNRGRAREHNVGWRIDYQIVTPPVACSIESTWIEQGAIFSDHAPFVVTYQGDWCV